MKNDPLVQQFKTGGKHRDHDCTLRLSPQLSQKSISWFKSPKCEENTETLCSHTPTFAPCFAKIYHLVQQSTTGGKHTETHTHTFLPTDSILVGKMAIKTSESWFDSWQGVLFSKASRLGQPTIQWLLGAVFPGVSGPGRDGNQSTIRPKLATRATGVYMHPLFHSLFWHKCTLHFR